MLLRAQCTIILPDDTRFGVLTGMKEARSLDPTSRMIADLIHAWDEGRPLSDRPPVRVDGPAVRDLLVKQHVEGPLGAFLSPDMVTAEFAAVREEALSRSGYLLLELERILPRITYEGCQPIVLKGAALAATIYPRLEDRWFLDLDILVPKAQVAAVCRLLEEAGYRSFRGTRAARFYDEYHLHRIMIGPQGTVVEIHWDLTLPTSVYGFDLQGVWGRSEPVPLGGTVMRVASRVDQVLHGVYQNIADGYTDLRRVLDLMLLCRTLSRAECHYIIENARLNGMEVGLWISLHIVKSITGQEAPSLLMTAVSPGRGTRRAIRGLKMADCCVHRQAAEKVGFTQALHLLTTRGAWARLREIGGCLWLAEGRLLDLGHRPGQFPHPARRFLMVLRQIKVLAQGSFRLLGAFLRG